jgi:hypothetical protein
VKARKHGWESDKKNGGVSVRVEFMVDTDILKNKKLMDGIDGYLSDMDNVQ